MISRTIAANPKGTSVSRFLTSLVLTDGHPMDAAALAEQRCATTPHVAEALRQMMKTAVGALNTGSGLNAIQAVANEFYLLAQSTTIADRLAQRCRRGQFRTKVARELGSGAGAAWRGEGLPTPLTKTLTDLLELDYFELSTITVCSRDMFRFDPFAEQQIRDDLVMGIARKLDADLLDPANSGTAGVKPASLTNGAASVTSSGGTAANIIADWKSLLAAVTTPQDGLVAIMRRSTLNTINAILAGVGYPTSADSLFSVPVIAGSTSPQQITLVDAPTILFAYDEEIAADVATESTLEMSDAPSQSGISGSGTTAVSLMQGHLASVRTTRGIAWQAIQDNAGSPTQPGGVAYMATAY